MRDKYPGFYYLLHTYFHIYLTLLLGDTYTPSFISNTTKLFIRTQNNQQKERETTGQGRGRRKTDYKERGSRKCPSSPHPPRAPPPTLPAPPVILPVHPSTLPPPSPLFSSSSSSFCSFCSFLLIISISFLHVLDLK